MDGFNTGFNTGYSFDLNGFGSDFSSVMAGQMEQPTTPYKTTAIAPVNNAGQPATSEQNAIINALAYGFGRWVDSKTPPAGTGAQAPRQATGTGYGRPVQGNSQEQGGGVSGNTLLLAAAVGAAFLLLN